MRSNTSFDSFVKRHGKKPASLADGWHDFGELDLPRGNLAIGDPQLFPEATKTKTPVGVNRVQIRVARDEGEVIVAGLRVFAGEPQERGRAVGEVGVDFSMLALADHDRLRQACEALTPEESERVVEALDSATHFGVVTWSNKVKLISPFVHTPYGDGGFTIYQLRGASGSVGVELDFTEVQESDD